FSARSQKIGTSSALPRAISMEGVTTRAAALRVRVIDHEPPPLQAIDEINGRARQVRHAHTVDDDLEAGRLTGHTAGLVRTADVSPVTHQTPSHSRCRHPSSVQT